MKRARTIRPFLASILTIFVLQNAASAKSISLEACFQNQNGSVGKISMDPKTIDLRWDVDDFTEASRESGKVEGFKVRNQVVSGTALMTVNSDSAAADDATTKSMSDRTEDLGGLQISISKTSVVFQEVSSFKEALSAEQAKPRVVCPGDTSPLALVEE